MYSSNYTNLTASAYSLNNVYGIKNSEPLAMGVTDYGVKICYNNFSSNCNSSGYVYNSTSFNGAARINNLLAHSNISNNGNVTLQLNLILVFNSTANKTDLREYWVQDVADIDTATKTVFFHSNIYNYSSTSMKISCSGLSVAHSCELASGNVAYVYNTGATQITYPYYLLLEMNATTLNGVPGVTFAYYNGSRKYNVFDRVNFSSVSLEHAATFLVDGFVYAGGNGTHYYDAEFVLGGGLGGQITNDTGSNVNLSLAFWNSHNYQQIANAFNFGENTAEQIGNVNDSYVHNSNNGDIYAAIINGIGGNSFYAYRIGKLYNNSQVSTVYFKFPITSGKAVLMSSVNQLDPYSSSNNVSFTGRAANLTLAPGNFTYALFNASGKQIFSDFLGVKANTSKTIDLNYTNFTESGLPAGHYWWVTYENVLGENVTQDTIDLINTNGTYTYHIAALSNATGDCRTSYKPNVTSVSLPAGSKVAIGFSGSTFCTPPDITRYEGIVVYDSQRSAIPSGFQQLINVSNAYYDGLANDNLSNVEFFYQNDTIIHSWLENYSYAKSALWWAKLEGMPPDSNLTIYMGFASNTTNLLNNW